MTVWEIAELLNVTGTAVKNTIKRIGKQSVLKDFQHSQYIKLENGYSAHVYDCLLYTSLRTLMNETRSCHNNWNLLKKTNGFLRLFYASATFFISPQAL